MKTERWKIVEELFERVSALPPESREQALAEEAGGDGQLVAEVRSLLDADRDTRGFLEMPAVAGGVRRLLGDRYPGAPVPERIGPYKLLRNLGEGGMSRVHLAVRDDDEFQKLVAIKVIRHGMASADIVRRFRTERQILASLDHSNIARLFDGGTTEDGLPYFVMEYIEGIPIDEYCDRNRLAVEARLRLFLTVCSAVHYAHQNLVIHRDLKASNILVTPRGVPKLLDFGIAKLLKPESFPVPVELTAAGLRPLTPYYASPEQVQSRPITTASDVYSLGVLLYRLLTGHFPYRFGSGRPKDVEKAVLEQEPESPATAVSRVESLPAGSTGGPTRLDPETVCESRATRPRALRRLLAGDLDKILLMALRKEPQRRYGSVEQFADDIQRYLDGEPVRAHRDSFRYRAGKFLRRNRVAVAVATGFVALLSGLALTMTVQAARIAHERDQAQRERDRAEHVVRFMQSIFQRSDPHEGGGDTITAGEILERGADRVSRELADQPEVQATLMEAIGNVYKNLGLYDPSERMLRGALALRQKVYGLEHLAVAQSLNNLGVVLRHKGDYLGAEPLFEEALAQRRRLLGDRHPDVADSLNNLGRLHYELGDFAEAERLYRRAIEVQRQASGADSPELSEQLGNLAILITEMGNFAAAEPLFQEALEVRRRAFGADHPLVAESLNNFGVFLGMRGDYAAAEPLFREALDMRRRLLGNDHPDVAESLNNLGMLLKGKGDYVTTERLYREAIAIRIKHLGRDHKIVAQHINNLAVLLHEKGDLAPAEATYREALAIRRKVLGDRHADTGVSMVQLGSLLVERGETPAAEELLREGVGVLRQALPANHWRVAEAETYLGSCLVAEKRYDEAEPLLVQGFESLRLSRGLEHRRTRDALERLLELYDRWPRPEAAARYRELATS